MTITKNNKTYAVKELKYDWKLSISIGQVYVYYQVSKQECPTFADLEIYVANNKAFMGE